MTTLAELEAAQKVEYVNPDKSASQVYLKAEADLNNSKVMEKLNAIVKGKSRVIHFDVDIVKDQDWVAETAFIKGYNLAPEHEERRFWTTADRKFEDTSLGGNYVCNPRPGYTPYADVPKPGLLNRSTFSPLSPANNLGMGSYYSEAVDDSYQVLDLRFGKPEYNSLPGFLSSFYSAKDALLANTGVYSPGFYGLGVALGTAGMFLLLGPMVAVSILAVSWVGGFVQGILLTNPHKFYYVRPTMSMYWRGVSNIVNGILSYKGVHTGNGNDPLQADRSDVDADILSKLKALAPNIFDDNGSVNVRQVINRAERINQNLKKKMAARIESAQSYEDLMRAARDIASDLPSNPSSPSEDELHGAYAEGVSKETDPEKIAMNTLMAGTMEERFEGPEGEKEMQKAFTDGPVEAVVSKAKKFWDYLTMEMSDGSAFATFRVDHTGPVSESFSHSTMKNDLGEKFNQVSAQGRAAHFTFAGGNVLPGMGEILAATKSVMAGALAAVKLDGLLSLAGSSYVDIPEGWENAAYQAPSMNYTMRLQSPHGHPLAQLQHIYIPLAMILSGVLPHAAGRSAYTMPYLCEAYDRGRGIVRTGLINQVMITRGVSNLGFTKNKDMLAVDVQFSIKDLSSCMYMPLEMGVSVDPRNTIHTYDTAYSDYLATLGSATLGQNVYKGQKLRIRARQWLGEVSQLATIDHWALLVRELPGINMLDIFYPDSGRGN